MGACDFCVENGTSSIAEVLNSSKDCKLVIEAWMVIAVLSVTLLLFLVVISEIIIMLCYFSCIHCKCRRRRHYYFTGGDTFQLKEKASTDDQERSCEKGLGSDPKYETIETGLKQPTVQKNEEVNSAEYEAVTTQSQVCEQHQLEEVEVSSESKTMETNEEKLDPGRAYENIHEQNKQQTNDDDYEVMSSQPALAREQQVVEVEVHSEQQGRKTEVERQRKEGEKQQKEVEKQQKEGENLKQEKEEQKKKEENLRQEDDKQKKEVEKQKNEVEKLKQEEAKQKNEVENLKQEEAKQKNEVENLKQEANKQKKEVGKQESEDELKQDVEKQDIKEKLKQEVVIQTKEEDKQGGQETAGQQTESQQPKKAEEQSLDEWLKDYDALSAWTLSAFTETAASGDTTAADHDKPVVVIGDEVTSL